MKEPNWDDYTVIIEAYKIAVDEYRFQVRLAWDRNRFFLLGAMTGISAAVALIRFSDQLAAALLTPILFGLSACLAILGLSAQKIGKTYYRRTLDQLNTIVDTINEEGGSRSETFVRIPRFLTTKGMAEMDAGIARIGSYNRINRGSFSSYLRSFFILIFIASSLGFLASLYVLTVVHLSSGIAKP